MLKKLAAAGLVFWLLAAASHAGAVSAESYALVEQTTGRVIASSNAAERLPMASTTKIMTALLACESGKLDETVTVPAEALNVEGSSMGLVAEEKITLRELVCGLLLESGNDAANTIAITLGGSLPGFAAMMNEKAAELKLTGTHYMNPSGLDDKDHYTTALDLARLGAQAMKNAEFAKIAGTVKMRVSYNGMKNGRLLVNHNKLLGSYAGEIGIKTGFTKKCGRCLVSCARRDGVTLVLATLNDPDDWSDHKTLLDSGFSQLKSRALFTNPAKYTVSVSGGTQGNAALSYDTGLAASLSDTEASQVKMTLSLPKTVKAPVKAGQKIGQITFALGGTVVAKTDLKAAETVPRQTAAHAAGGFFSAIGDFFKRLFGL